MLLWMLSVVIPLVLLGVVAALAFRRRSGVDAFAARQGLEIAPEAAPVVDAWLRRTHRWQGAAALVAVVGGAVWVVLAWSVEALLWLTPVALALAVLGGLVGTALAQLPRSHTDEPVHVASLAPRDVVAYRPRGARLAVRSLVGGMVVVTAVAWAIAVIPIAAVTTVLLIQGLGVLAFASLCERRVARRARDAALEPDVDDAVRRVAVRALHIATAGVLACLAAFSLWVLAATFDKTVVRVDGRVVWRAPLSTVSSGVGHSSGATTVYAPDGTFLYSITTPQPLVISWTDRAGDHTRDLGIVTGTVTSDTEVEYSLIPIALVAAGYACLAGAVVAYAAAARAWRVRGEATTATPTAVAA